MIQWSQLSGTETAFTGTGAALLWIMYVWFTIRRQGSKEGLLRGGLLFIALLSLCLIIWKPQYRVNKPGGKALLLTDYTTTIPDSMKVFALPHVKVPPSVPKVPDIAFIERNYREISLLYVNGAHLPPEQLHSLQRLHIELLPEQNTGGFSWLSYKGQIPAGDSLVVSGTYVNLSGDTIKLALSTLEGVQDSVLLTRGTTRFALQGMVKVPGEYTATIHITSGEGTRTEPLPYVVEPRKPLQVLMLQAFPSFEMNYLKDWLAGEKHKIQVRSQISRGKYFTQWVNTPQSRTRPLLSGKQLDTYDVLIADAQSLRQLSSVEKKRIRQAIQQGLGILILPDDDWLKNPEAFGRKFTLMPSGQQTFVPRQHASVQAAAMAEKHPVSFREQDFLIPVAYSRQQEVIAAYIPEGEGRIGAGLAAATFPWILQGEAGMYSNFWTNILASVKRRTPEKDLHISGTPFLYQNNLNTFSVTDTLLTPVTITYVSGRQQQLMPEKSLFNPLETTYQFRPLETGWITIHAQADTTHTWAEYILPQTAWTDVRQATWQRTNREKLSPPASARRASVTSWEEVPLVWFFLLIITSLGLLWWHEKQFLHATD